MATNEKKTIATLYGEILSQYELTDEHKAFIEKELGKVEKKKSSNSKSKAREEKANVRKAVGEKIYNYLVETGKAMRCSELVQQTDCFDGIELPSTSLANYILGELIAEGKVEKVSIKGASHFKATKTAEVEETEEVEE